MTWQGTPGPWRVNRDARHIGNRRIVGEHGLSVAKVYADFPVEADAKAIANAAAIAAVPQLVEALAGCVSFLTKAAERNLLTFDGEILAGEFAEQGKAALRAAKVLP